MTRQFFFWTQVSMVMLAQAGIFTMQCYHCPLDTSQHGNAGTGWQLYNAVLSLSSGHKSAW